MRVKTSLGVAASGEERLQVGQECPFGLLGRHGCEVALTQGQKVVVIVRRQKVVFGFLFAKADELARFAVGGALIGLFDFALVGGVQVIFQSEFLKDGLQQTLFDDGIGIADECLEGRNEVTDDILGTVMQECCELNGVVGVGVALGKDGLDE